MCSRWPQAVHADDVGASVEQRFRGIGGAFALGGFILVFEADRDHRGQASLLGALHGDQRFTQPGKSFADNEVHPFVDLHR